MSGKILVGNTNNIATLPKNILVGNPNNIARNVKGIYIGNSQNQAVQVWPSGGVPSGYTILSYIQNNRSTRQQFISTLIKPNSLTSILIGFKMLERSRGTIFSLRYDDEHVICSCLFLPDNGYYYGKFILWFGNEAIESSDYKFLTSNWTLQYNGENGKFRLYNDDEKRYYVDRTLTNSFSTTTGNITLFYPVSGGYEGSSNWLQIKYCRIWSNRQDNNSIVRDYIPVRRDNDGIIGLYDIKEQKFYPNSYSSSLDYNFYGA